MRLRGSTVLLTTLGCLLYLGSLTVEASGGELSNPPRGIDMKASHGIESQPATKVGEPGSNHEVQPEMKLRPWSSLFNRGSSALVKASRRDTRATQTRGKDTDTSQSTRKGAKPAAGEPVAKTGRAVLNPLANPPRGGTVDRSGKADAFPTQLQIGKQPRAGTLGKTGKPGGSEPFQKPSRGENVDNTGKAGGNGPLKNGDHQPRSVARTGKIDGNEPQGKEEKESRAETDEKDLKAGENEPRREEKESRDEPDEKKRRAGENEPQGGDEKEPKDETDDDRKPGENVSLGKSENPPNAETPAKYELQATGGSEVANAAWSMMFFNDYSALKPFTPSPSTTKRGSVLGR